MANAIESIRAAGSPTEPGDQSAIRGPPSDTSAAGESIDQVPAQATDNLQQHQPAQQPEDDKEEDDQEVISPTDSDIVAQLGSDHEGAAATEALSPNSAQTASEYAVPSDGASDDPATPPQGSHASNVFEGVPMWYIHNPPSSFGGHLTAACSIWLTARNSNCRLRRHASDT
ncbi:hypothetical protein WJX77_011435 [Trebouxia sp. C0004]